MPGARRAVWFGGITIAAGHFSLAVPGRETLFLGLILLVLGLILLGSGFLVMSFAAKVKGEVADRVSAC